MKIEMNVSELRDLILGTVLAVPTHYTEPKKKEVRSDIDIKKVMIRNLDTVSQAKDFQVRMNAVISTLLDVGNDNRLPEEVQHLLLDTAIDLRNIRALIIQEYNAGGRVDE